MNNKFNAYQQNQVMTAPQEKLVIMLYDGLLRFVKNAAASCEEKNIEDTNSYLSRAQAILAELMGNLNHDAGETAENLLLLYDYMYRRLVEANIKKDVEIINEVQGMVGELKEAWQQAVQSLHAQQCQNHGYKEGITAQK